MCLLLLYLQKAAATGEKAAKENLVHPTKKFSSLILLSKGNACVLKVSLARTETSLMQIKIVF